MRHRKLIAAISISLALVIVLSVFALPPTLWQNRIDKLRNISVHEAYAIITYKLNQTYMVILDVRTKTEFDEGHIANAINIAHTDLEANLSDPAHCPLNGHENHLILVYCKFGGRSSIASEILALDANIGPFTNIYNMIGGTTEWANPAWNYTLVVTPPYADISATEAHLMVTSGSPTYGFCNITVDVRTPGEYITEYIINSTTPPILHAINIPYYNNSNFATRLGPISGHKTEPIIVYCVNEACAKAAAACQYLFNNGYTKVHRMVGGFDAWKAKGYPTYPPASWILVDSYNETNRNTLWTLKEQHPSATAAHSGVAQSFTPASPYSLTSCRLYLRKVGSPAGTITARLYAHSGTYGTTSVPVEASMIEESSTSIDISTGLTTSYSLYAFDFAGTTPLTADTQYCIAIMVKLKTTLNDSNYIEVGADTTSPTHSGNCALFEKSNWMVAHTASDMIFFVYGK